MSDESKTQPADKGDKGKDKVPASPGGQVELTDEYLKNFGKWDDHGASALACSCQRDSCNN